MKQLRAANTNVPYEGGWCLDAVRRVFGIANKYPTAMADWQSGNKHPELPPKGYSVPVYLSLKNEPAGHVAVSLPDGRVASSTQAGKHSKMFIHPNLDDLLSVYAAANGGATYLGWSEEVNDVPVVEGGNQDMPFEEFVRYILAAYYPGVQFTQEQINAHASYFRSRTDADRVQWLKQKPEEGGHYITEFHALEFYDRARGGKDPIQFANDRLNGGARFDDVMRSDMPKYQAAMDKPGQGMSPTQRQKLTAARDGINEALA